MARTASTRTVHALLSLDRHDCKLRVMRLYREWYRTLPWLVRRFDIPKDVKMVRAKLREEFLANRHMNQIRAIDMLVIRGHMLLQEVHEVWLQKGHLMRMYRESEEPKPKTFKGRFLTGKS